jgi:hypothetical protein
VSKVVYHVSSTLQLPWIVESGELRPYPNEDVGIGHTTFLWATTKRAGIGDQTSYGARLTRTKEAAWQEDLFRLVRFTLPAEGFLTWNETVREEGWTDAAVAELVASDREDCGEDGQDQWRCRAAPLRLAAVLKVEARTYAGRWRPLDLILVGWFEPAIPTTWAIALVAGRLSSRSGSCSRWSAASRFTTIGPRTWTVTSWRMPPMWPG